MKGTTIAAAAALLFMSGCNQVRSEDALPAAAPVEPAASGDIAAFAGANYPDFVTAPGMERYAPTGLGLPEAAQTRFAHATSQTAPGWIVEGGGTRALVFVGCAAEACAQAAAVLAIDVGTGATFAAVRDAGGRDILIANQRLEALVEATSPADRWDDPAAWAADEPLAP